MSISQLSNVTIIRSRRKTTALQILPDGQIVVRAPWHRSDAQIRELLLQRTDWIRRTRARLQQVRQDVHPLTQAELEVLTQQARQVIPVRVAHYGAALGVTWGRITIRHQRSRWGSCSAAGNLNFNCLLMRTPPEVLDYVVVHELCHRRELNHSPAFWALVGQILPEYRTTRQWLKEHGSALIALLPESPHTH